MQYAPTLVTQKRIDFSGPRVGAYCIRPTKHHFNDGGCRKRDTFLGYKDLIIPKRSTFWAFIFNGLWKRDTFPIYINLGKWISGALPPFPYLLFLSWYKKRRQKKIKASAEAGEDDRVHEGSRKRTEKNFPAPVGVLSWYKKRRQKKIKASAEAGEDDRVHEGSRKCTGFWAYLFHVSPKTHHVTPSYPTWGRNPRRERNTYLRGTYWAWAFHGIEAGEKPNRRLQDALLGASQTTPSGAFWMPPP